MMKFQRSKIEISDLLLLVLLDLPICYFISSCKSDRFYKIRPFQIDHLLPMNVLSIILSFQEVNLSSITNRKKTIFEDLNADPVIQLIENSYLIDDGFKPLLTLSMNYFHNKNE